MEETSGSDGKGNSGLKEDNRDKRKVPRSRKEGITQSTERERKQSLTLDPWQKEILQHEGNILLCTGRQVGKTTILAAKAAEYMIKHPKSRIIAVSLTEDQAFLMRIMVEDYLKANYPTYLKVPKKDKPTKNKVIINNKSSYLVRPVGNTGDALRGFTGEVLIVDEASFMPELVWQSSKPTLLITGGQIWMCSTPHVKEGWFYEQFEACKSGKSDRFKVWHISSEEVVYNRELSETWTIEKQQKAIKFLEDEKGSMSKTRYAQEYLGLYMDDIQRYFSDEWINEVCTLQPQRRLPEQEYYLGLDIARMGGDETAYEIMQKVNKNNYIHIYNETETHEITTHTISRILELDKIWKFKRIYIDAGAGSLGVGIFDQLLNNDQTKRKVEAVNNRKILLDKDGKGKQRLLKEDLYDNLKALGEMKKLRLLDDENVRLSLRSIIWEVVQSKYGHSRIYISGNYSHIVEGLIRAAVCAKEKNINMFISSFKV